MQALDIEILDRKIKLKNQALSILRQDEKNIRRDIKTLRWRKVLLEIKHFLEKEIQNKFDPEHSRKLDAVRVLLND
jgi:hypothetical protein